MNVGGDEETVGVFSLLTRLAIAIASAAAVASSSSEAEAISSPVRSRVTCWKFSSDSRRPWKPPADKAYRRYTSPDFPACCAESPAAARRLAHANVRLEALVTTGDRLQFRQRGEFRGCFAHLRRRCQLDILRHNLANQGVKRIGANGFSISCCCRASGRCDVQ